MQRKHIAAIYFNIKNFCANEYSSRHFSSGSLCSVMMSFHFWRSNEEYQELSETRKTTINNTPERILWVFQMYHHSTTKMKFYLDALQMWEIHSTHAMRIKISKQQHNNNDMNNLNGVYIDVWMITFCFWCVECCGFGGVFDALLLRPRTSETYI